MAKFGHLRKLEVKDKTVEYPLYQLAGEMVLIVKPATEANKPYFNEVLRRSKKNMRQISAGSIDSALIEQNRADDRKLFPEHVIVGWKNVVDSDKKIVPFTKEDCKDFLDSIPDWIFDDIRAFATNSSSIAQAAIQMEEVAKN